MKKDKRTHRIYLHLNNSELEVFNYKAKNYPNMSYMIRDAVNQFNDQSTILRIDSLNSLSALISSVRIELAKQGGNLNQTLKSAKELIYFGDLNQQYYDDVILPQIQELRELLTKASKQQTQIFKKIMKL